LPAIRWPTLCACRAHCFDRTYGGFGCRQDIRAWGTGLWRHGKGRIGNDLTVDTVGGIKIGKLSQKCGIFRRLPARFMLRAAMPRAADHG
jgi:hypothetical protein